MTATIEDYLEAILILSDEDGEARSVDVANFLRVSKPTVHKTTHYLKEQGLIVQRPYGGLILTDEGRAQSKRVLAKHETLKRFLTEVLQVAEQTAEADACRMEHAVSAETLKKIKEYMKNP